MVTDRILDATYKIAVGPITPAKIPRQSDLPPNDPTWRAFNGAFENREVTQLALADLIYTGHPYTVWHANHWRVGKNFILGQAIGLDFDTKDARSTIVALKQEPFIARHAALLYTTMSHTPDAPRARVVFLLDQPIQQAKNYILAATALLWLFGDADSACRDAVRFWYGGKPNACEMEWLGGELPLALVKDLIARYQLSGLQAKQHVTHTYPPGNADEAEVMAALQKIPAWQIGYDEWLAVLMALHSEFPSSGLPMALAWADGKPGEVERMWQNYFNVNGNATGRVGIGSLFALAQQHGWQR
jgi:hypothetical protein